jgi:hypothetical protein
VPQLVGGAVLAGGIAQDEPLAWSGSARCGSHPPMAHSQIRKPARLTYMHDPCWSSVLLPHY